MQDEHCPKCGSSNVVPRTVNDRVKAADPDGEPFEIALHVQVWSCRDCKLCWQGHEAQVAMEAAYQNALVKAAPGRSAA